MLFHWKKSRGIRYLGNLTNSVFGIAVENSYAFGCIYFQVTADELGEVVKRYNILGVQPTLKDYYAETGKINPFEVKVSYCEI